jgi:serine/threonine protein kinase
MALAVGEMLQDRYRIDAEVETGGMAVVYRAWDTLLDLPVAVKEMVAQPRLSPKALVQLRRQFKREAQTLARLDHPSLVRVTDSFSQGDSEFLVMNYVEGESLGDRVERVGASSEAQVLDWADQLLTALSYCHSQGIFHRDVKSHNVIIRPDGQPVLIDFGLVKLWDPEDPQTKTVLRGMGTPAFAPPEQFEGDTEHTDELGDIYGMGATLYHALTGRLPPSAAWRTAMPEKFESLRSIVPEVSQQTETVVMKAMELARSKRWQSTDEMAKAVKEAELAEAGLTPGVQPAAQSQRKRVPMWIGALGTMTLLLVVVGSMIGLRAAGDGPTPALTPERMVAVSAPATSTETSTATPLPVSTPVLMPSPTPVVTATFEPTDTPSPTPTPTATATPSPIPTHSPTPAATPSLTMPWTPTLTLTPSLTHTSTPTEVAVRETPTPTATREIPTSEATLTPTVKPTVVLPQLYEQPKLLRPNFNQVFGFDQQQSIQLAWTPASLADDHWYEVQLRQAENEEPTERYWTKENWWDMGPEYYHSGDYYWQVVIVQGREADVVGAVSPPSEMWYFQWLPAVPASTPKPTSTPTVTPTATVTPTKTATPTSTPTNTPTPRPIPLSGG